MQIKSLLLTIYPDQGWRLQWDVDGIDNTHEIVIERASGPEGPWSVLDILDWNTIAYVDTEPSFRGFFDHLFYRLTVRLISDQSIIRQSEAVSTVRSGTKITNEIIRQHELTLKGVNTLPGFFSRKFKLYKRTKFGTKCHFCIDEDTGEALLDQCDQCNGTRYLEGWTNPVPFDASWRTQAQASSEITQLGDHESNRGQLFLAAFPVVEPGDVLIQQDDLTAWEVVSITTSSPGGYLVSQVLNLSQLDRQFIEARL